MAAAPPQKLYSPEGAILQVVHAFSDGGQAQVTTLVGGQHVLLSRGTPARNDVFLLTSGSFVYRDGKLVDRMEDTGHIPVPFQAKAIAQVEAVQKGQKPRVAPVARPRAPRPSRPVVPSARTGRPMEVFDPAEALGAEAQLTKA